MLASPFPQRSLVLLEGFWPTKNWMVNHSQLVEPSSLVSTNKENTMLEPLCGPKNMKPTMKDNFLHTLYRFTQWRFRPHTAIKP